MTERGFYRYRATLIESSDIYDADTLTLTVDLGFGILSRMRFRLLGVNAWEIRGPERAHGLIGRNWLRQQIRPGDEIVVESYKDKTGKFGRYLGALFIDDRCLNKELIELGHARENFYGSAKPDWW